MLNNLKVLCGFNAPSGAEDKLREYIISNIKDYCEYHVDNSGNIIAFKKGEKAPKHKIMVDAHLDEVGFIISAITSDGFLKFQTVGGFVPSALFCKRVLIRDTVNGVIGAKPVHLTKGDERKKCPLVDAMYIDIGAKSKQEAEALISVGDLGIVCGEFEQLGKNIKAKAIDNRVGCAVLIELLKSYNEYDFYATFTTGEEIGTRGAKTAAFTVAPDYAIVLEATTASDISGSSEANRVCALGEGPVISFMDNGTLYDRNLYNAALLSGVKCQPKTAVAGANNSAAIHLSKSGVKTIAISVPCRYIHSSGSVANADDIVGVLELAQVMLSKIGAGEIK